MFPADDSKNRGSPAVGEHSKSNCDIASKYDIQPISIHKEVKGVVNPQEGLECEEKISPDYSIEPKFAFKTIEFWLLSLKVLISELIFIYLLFVYKVRSCAKCNGYFLA